MCVCVCVCVCVWGGGGGGGAGARLNLKMSSKQYRNSHYKDNALSRPTWFYNGIPYMERPSLYWDGTQIHFNEDDLDFSKQSEAYTHDEIRKWKRFLYYWPFSIGTPFITGRFLLKGVISLMQGVVICWTNGQFFGDLWRHETCAITVMTRASWVTIYIQWHVSISSVNIQNIILIYDDVIKWKHFSRYWPFVRGIHRSPVNSPHKGQWGGALMFSLIYAWINGWVNNCEAGDFRRPLWP